jgi:hypothetical protein
MLMTVTQPWCGQRATSCRLMKRPNSQTNQAEARLQWLQAGAKGGVFEALATGPAPKFGHLHHEHRGLRTNG